MKNTLYLMCGIPGSGKSTFAKTYFPNATYVSRDEVRYSMVTEDKEYFSKEDQVFSTFVNKINEGLGESVDVIADATHLNPQSRAKLFSKLKINKNYTQVVAVVMRTPLNVCLERNENRRGTRAYVPPSVIRRMYNSFRMPTTEEYHGIIDIIRTITPRR